MRVDRRRGEHGARARRASTRTRTPSRSRRLTVPTATAALLTPRSTVIERARSTCSPAGAPAWSPATGTASGHHPPERRARSNAALVGPRL
jgi:hypothetical protein